MNRVALLAALIAFAIAFYYSSTQKVEIIYFYSKACVISNETDSFIDGIEAELGERVKVRRIDAFNAERDEEELVKKYDVKGVPVIVIDGRIYPYEYNYTLFKREVCKRFVFKPEKC